MAAAAWSPLFRQGHAQAAVLPSREQALSRHPPSIRPHARPSAPARARPSQYSSRTVANYAIRRLSVDYGVPLVTNLQVAALFAESMEKLALGGQKLSAAKLDVRSMQEHYADSLKVAGSASAAA